MSRRYVLVVSLIAVGLFAPTNPAPAADPGFCDGYAKEASQKVKLNNKLKCGFQGPRWGSDINGHRLWCLIADQNTAQAETDNRAKDIEKCTCQWYADQTMVQVATNTAKKCGFTGLRWLDDKKAHYDWCANFKPGMDAMMHEMKARKNMLKGC
jgi:hypothetical protein